MTNLKDDQLQGITNTLGFRPIIETSEEWERRKRVEFILQKIEGSNDLKEAYLSFKKKRYAVYQAYHQMKALTDGSLDSVLPSERDTGFHYQITIQNVVDGESKEIVTLSSPNSITFLTSEMLRILDEMKISFELDIIEYGKEMKL